MNKRLFFVLAAVICLTACQTYEEPAQYPGSDSIVKSQVSETEDILDSTQEGDTIRLYVAQDKWKYKNDGDMYGSPYGYYVHYDEDGYWENTRVPIINFDYERGYEYQIEVVLKYMVLDGNKKEPVYEWKNTIYSIKRK